MTLKDLANEKMLRLKEEIQLTIRDLREEGRVAATDLSVQLSALAEASQNQKTLCILNSLDFETRQSRQSDIADTEYRTFEWIYDDCHERSHQPVGFGKWLQSGNDIYWISGKPGSGKSVLMNFIANDSRTLEMLQFWAGNNKLVVAKFFFWNAGAPMQKSQQGLLQSLLREVFGQCPELVPVVCPSRWGRYHDIGAAWTRSELAEAFEKLGQQSLVNRKFCFFIDGVDEYDGEDYTRIIRILKDLDASPSVKICLSSRPWNIFSAAFGDNADRKLLLEDHNAGDIKRYINHRLQTDEQFASLQLRDSRGSSELVDQMVRNAQGVFLWVRIVVGNLLRGLSNDDSPMDLNNRLNTLPTTLTEYFQHMFDNIDDNYRQETAEILLICLEGIQPLSLLALWFYDQERNTTDYALQAEISSIGIAGMADIHKRIHKRIYARGQDLLSIEFDESRIDYQRFTVRFSHLTVKEFLSKPDMLKRLTSWKTKDFDARVAMCKATIAIIKSLPWATTKGEWWRRCNDFFTYAHLIEQDERILDDALVDEFQRVISSIRKLGNQKRWLEKVDRWVLHNFVGLVENDIWPVTWASVEQTPRYSGDMTNIFLAWAVEANLKGYILYKLQEKPFLMKRPFLRRPMLDQALRPLPWSPRTCGIDPSMVRLLLMHGADPNEELTVYRSGFVRTTVWILFLQSLCECASKTRKPLKTVQEEFEAVKLMIEHGAAASLRPWAISASPLSFNARAKTPSDVLHDVFPPRDAIVLDRLLMKHRPWALWRVCSVLRRTVLLWLYRGFIIVTTLISLLLSLFFNETLGVILPFVAIPAFLYVILLVWPIISPLAWSTALVVLPCLVLSDWIPILDVLFLVHNSVIRS